jgi:hypothetical protein
MPLQQHCRGDLNIPAKFLGGMSAQEQAIKKCSFPLRKIEVVLSFVSRVSDGQLGRIGYSLHRHPKTEREVYRNFSPRQVEWRKSQVTP